MFIGGDSARLKNYFRTYFIWPRVFSRGAAVDRSPRRESWGDDVVAGCLVAERRQNVAHDVSRGEQTRAFGFWSRSDGRGDIRSVAAPRLTTGAVPIPRGLRHGLRSVAAPRLRQNAPPPNRPNLRDGKPDGGICHRTPPGCSFPGSGNAGRRSVLGRAWGAGGLRSCAASPHRRKGAAHKVSGFLGYKSAYFVRGSFRPAPSLLRKGIRRSCKRRSPQIRTPPRIATANQAARRRRADVVYPRPNPPRSGGCTHWGFLIARVSVRDAHPERF